MERTLFVIDETRVNPELIEVALQHIITDAEMQVRVYLLYHAYTHCLLVLFSLSATQRAWRGDGGKCGAVLVFLPGMGEIQKVYEHLSVSQSLTEGLKGGSCVIHRSPSSRS
jgi:hypothetical protein